jgi:excisionase family DNA binding protein
MGGFLVHETSIWRIRKSLHKVEVAPLSALSSVDSLSEGASVRANRTVGEAADYLRISPKTLQRETDKGHIRVARIGRRLVYRTVDLDRYLELKVLAG